MPRVSAGGHAAGSSGGGSVTPRMHHGGVPPSFSAPVYLSAPLSPRSTTPRAAAAAALSEFPTTNAERSLSVTSQPPPAQAASRSNSVQAATIASANRMAIPALTFPTRSSGRTVSPPLASRRGVSPTASSRRYPSPETTRSLAGGGTTSRYGSPPSAAVPFRDQPVHVSAATPPLPMHMLRYVQHHSGQSRDDIPELESFFTHGRSVVHTIPDVYARCITMVNGEMWVGERSGAISRWGAHDAELLQRAERTNRSLFVTCLLPVGLHVWCGLSDGTLRILPTNDATRPVKEVKEHAGAITCMELSHNERFVFTGSLDFIITHWNALDGTRLQALAGHHNAVRCLLVVGIRLFSGGDDNRIIEWDVTKGAVLHTLAGHRGGVRCLQASTLYLWSGGEDATVRIWSLQGDGSGIEKPVLMPPPQQPTWDPVALVASVAAHGPTQASQAVLRSLQAQLVVPTCVHVISNPFTAAVTHLDVVGSKIWSVSLGTVFVWNNATFALEAQFKEHPGTISAVHTVRQSVLSRVWSCGTEGAILLWNVESNYHSAMRASSDLHLSRLEHSLEQHFVREEMLSAEALIHRTENERLTGVVADLNRELSALRCAKSDAEQQAANAIATLEATLAARDLEIQQLDKACRALNDRLGIPISGREQRMKLLSEQACRGTTLVADTPPHARKMEASFHAIQQLRDELDTLHMERVLLANEKLEKRLRAPPPQHAAVDAAPDGASLPPPQPADCGSTGPITNTDEDSRVAAALPSPAAGDAPTTRDVAGASAVPTVPVVDDLSARRDYAVADSNELRSDIWRVYEWCGRIEDAVHGLNAAACDVLSSPASSQQQHDVMLEHRHDDEDAAATDTQLDTQSNRVAVRYGAWGGGAQCIAYDGESVRAFGFLSLRELTVEERQRVVALQQLASQQRPPSSCGSDAASTPPSSPSDVFLLPARANVATGDRDWLQSLYDKYRGSSNDGGGARNEVGERRLPRSLRLLHLAAVRPNAPQPSAHRHRRHSSGGQSKDTGAGPHYFDDVAHPSPHSIAADDAVVGDRVGVSGYQCALDAVFARLQQTEASVATFADRLLSQEGSLVHHLHVREAALRRIIGLIAPKVLQSAASAVAAAVATTASSPRHDTDGDDDGVPLERHPESNATAGGDPVPNPLEEEGAHQGNPQGETDATTSAQPQAQPSSRTVLLADADIIKSVEAFEQAIKLRAAEWKWQSEALQQLLDGYLSLAADATPVLEELAAVCDSATNDDADGREQHTDVANNRATSATMEALSNDGDGTQQGEGADAATTAMSEEDDASANPLASAHMYPSSFFSQRHSSMTPHALVQRSRNTCLTVFQLARAHLQHADRSDRNHRQHEMDLQRALDAEIQQRRSVESVLMSVDACARQSAQQLEHPIEAPETGEEEERERTASTDKAPQEPQLELDPRRETSDEGSASSSSPRSEASQASSVHTDQDLHAPPAIADLGGANESTPVNPPAPAVVAVDGQPLPQAALDAMQTRVQYLADLGRRWADTAKDAQTSRDALRTVVDAVDSTITAALQTLHDPTAQPPNVIAAVHSVAKEGESNVSDSSSTGVEERCRCLVQTSHALVQHMISMGDHWHADEMAFRDTANSIKHDCLEAVSLVRHIPCDASGADADDDVEARNLSLLDAHGACSLLIDRTATLAAALARERCQRQRMDSTLFVTLLQWRAQLRQHHAPAPMTGHSSSDDDELLLAVPAESSEVDDVFAAPEHAALRRAINAVAATVHTQVAQSVAWAATIRNHVASWCATMDQERAALVDGTMQALKGAALSLHDAQGRLHGVAVGDDDDVSPMRRRKSIRKHDHHHHGAHRDDAANDGLARTSLDIHDAAHRVATLVHDATERLALHRASEQNVLAAIHKFVAPFPEMMLQELLTPERPQQHHLDSGGGGGGGGASDTASSSAAGPAREDDDILATIMRNMKREPRFIGCCQATWSSDINSTRSVESINAGQRTVRRADDGSDTAVSSAPQGTIASSPSSVVADFWASKLQLLLQQRDVLKMWCALLAAFARDQHATAADREAKWMRVIQRLTDEGGSQDPQQLSEARGQRAGTVSLADAAAAAEQPLGNAAVAALRPEALSGWFTATSVGGALGGVDTNATAGEARDGVSGDVTGNRRPAMAQAPCHGHHPTSPSTGRLILSPGSKGKSSARRKVRQRAEQPHQDDNVWTAGLDALAPSTPPMQVMPYDSSEDDDAGWVPPPKSAWLQLEKECMHAKQELALLLDQTPGLVSPSKRNPGALIEDDEVDQREGHRVVSLGRDEATTAGRNHNLVLRQALPLLERYRTMLHEGLAFCTDDQQSAEAQQQRASSSGVVVLDGSRSQSETASAAAGAFVDSDGEASSDATAPSEAVERPDRGGSKSSLAASGEDNDLLNSDDSVSADALLAAFDCIRRDILDAQSSLVVHSSAAYRTLLMRHADLAAKHVSLLDGLRGGLNMRALPVCVNKRTKRPCRDDHQGPSPPSPDELAFEAEPSMGVDVGASSDCHDNASSTNRSTETEASSSLEGSCSRSEGDEDHLSNPMAAAEPLNTIQHDAMALSDLRQFRHRVDSILDVDVPRAEAAAAIRIASDAAVQAAAEEDASVDRRQSLLTIRRLFGLNRRYEVALRRGIAASHEGGDPEAELDAAERELHLPDGLPSALHNNDGGVLQLEPAGAHRTFTDAGRSQSFVSTAGGGSSVGGLGDCDTVHELPVSALSAFLRDTCASAVRGADRVDRLLADADAQLSHFSVQVLQACNTMAHKYTRTLDQLLHIGSIAPPWRPKLSKRWQHALTGAATATTDGRASGGADGGDDEEGRGGGDDTRQRPPPMTDAAETVQFHRELNQQLLKRVEIVEAHVDRHKEHLRQLPTYAAWAAMFSADEAALDVIRAHAAPPPVPSSRTALRPTPDGGGDASVAQVSVEGGAASPPPHDPSSASTGEVSPLPEQPAAPPPSLRQLHTQLTQNIAATFAQLDSQWQGRFAAQNKQLEELLAHCRANLPAKPTDLTTAAAASTLRSDENDATDLGGAYLSSGPSLLQRTLSSMSAAAAASRAPVRRKSFAKTSSSPPRRGSIYFSAAGGGDTVSAGGTGTARRASVSFAEGDSSPSTTADALHPDIQHDTAAWARLVVEESELLAQLHQVVDGAKVRVEQLQAEERDASSRLATQEQLRVEHEAHIHNLLSEVDALHDLSRAQCAAIANLEAYKAERQATHDSMLDATTNTDCNLLQTYEMMYNDTDNACRQLTAANTELRDSNAKLWAMVQAHAVGGGGGCFIGGDEDLVVGADGDGGLSYQDGVVVMQRAGAVDQAPATTLRKDDSDAVALETQTFGPVVGPDVIRSTSVVTAVDTQSEVATLRSSDAPVQLPTTPRRSSPHQLPSYMQPIRSGRQVTTPSPTGRSRGASSPSPLLPRAASTNGRTSPGPRHSSPNLHQMTAPRQRGGHAVATAAPFRDTPQLADASAHVQALGQQLEDIKRAMAMHREQFRSLIFTPTDDAEAADDERGNEASTDNTAVHHASPSVTEMKHCMQRYDALREAHWTDFCSVASQYQGASQHVIELLLAALRRLHRVGFLVESRPPMLRAVYELYTVLLIGIRSITTFAKHTHEGRISRREALAHVDRIADEVATATEGAAWMLANLFTDDELAHVGASPHLLPPDVRRPTWRDIALPSHYNEFLLALSVAERSVTPERAAAHRQHHLDPLSSSADQTKTNEVGDGATPASQLHRAAASSSGRFRTSTPPKRSLLASPRHQQSPAKGLDTVVSRSPRHQPQLLSAPTTPLAATRRPGASPLVVPSPGRSGTRNTPTRH